jgi:hypothetical protein
MRKIIPGLLKLVCVLALVAGAPAEAANKDSQKSSAASVKKSTTGSKKAPSTKKSTPSKKASKTKTSKSGTGSSGGKSVPKADNSVAGERDTRCRNVRVKTSKGYRTQRKCGSGGEAAALHGGATEPVDGAKGADLKARTIPDRAYAVDGYTFFHQGRKYRILGIDEGLVPAGSDLAKQRLQLALDSGQVAVEPESVDDSGTVRALVRVGGKNLAEVLNAK